ncbi:MAG: hypothetical protein Q7J05_06770 [Paludibacter sp.]|nr:hypothetical protein [Paludibacter sp.]
MKQQIQTILILLGTIFVFNSCSEDEIYPAANFSTTGFVPGFKWVLDASSSVSVEGKALSYRWDYDEDQSQFDTPWLTDPVYVSVGQSINNYIKIVTLQVKDENGRITEVSKEVYRSRFMYNFRLDTLRMNQIEIPRKRYQNEKAGALGGDWMTWNFLLSGSDNVTNTTDSLQNGSYISWNEAAKLKFVYSYFSLPNKSDWQNLIDLFYGETLAGYNLQVDNQYGLGLGLSGYVVNNQLQSNGSTGYYWTSTEVDDTHAWALEVSENSDTVRFVSLPKNYRCKVRLVYAFH